MNDADDGAILALLEATPWERTPLGPRASWSQSLKTAWSICRHSRFPMILFWGPEFVQLYNAAYAPLVGDKHPRAFGQRSAECFAEIWDQIGPMLRGVLDDGVATYSEDLFLPLDRRDGPEACYFTFSYSPVLGAGDRTEGVFCAVTETTRQVVGERRLRTLNAFEEAVRAAETVEAASEAATGTFAASGDAAACEIRLKAPFHHIARAGTDDATTIVEPLSDGNTVLGTIAFARNVLNPLDDDYHAFFRLAAKHTAAALARTMAYEAERQRVAALEELNRAKNAFFHNVSHEFRTPLMLMLGPLDDLYARVLDVDQRRAIELARRNAVRLQKLVDTLLEFSRVEANRHDAAFARTDVAALTKDISSEFQSAFEATGLRLEVRDDGVPDDLWLDRAMYEKILLNLLSNALKFTFEGGATVTTSADGDRFVLTVADTGTGIPDSDLERVFERFHRVRGARSRTHEGSGIGLALVRELARIHGGTIEVASSGAGTTFRVALPFGTTHLSATQIVATPPSTEPAIRRQFRAEAAVIAGAGSAPAASASVNGTRSRVLLADDNADLRAYLTSLLSPRYQVDAVADGGALLEAARMRPPDLIVTDVMMPHVDGIEAVKQLRAGETTRGIPILMLSARAGDEYSVEGLDAGADDYLVKPFTAAQLLARVDALLRRTATFDSGLATRTTDAREWRLLATASERFAVAQSPAGVLEALAEMLVPGFADWCVVQLREGDSLQRVAIAHPQRAKRDLLWSVDRLYPYVVGDDSMIGIAAATGRTQLASDLSRESLRLAARDPIHLSILEALQLHSAIVVALRDGDNVLGLITVVQSESGRRFNERDARTLELLAARATLAYTAATSSERERSIASTLQRALLPGALPVVDGLDFSVSYTPAAEDIQIGGDWYDAFPLPDGRIVLSIGDVVGHGLDAAVAMAALRHAIRGYAVEDSRPGAILAHLNRVLLSEGRGDLATALVAVIDPRTLEVAFASAGHYGPVIATGSDHGVQHLTMIGSMLGIEETAYDECTFRLPPHATMVFYTDGLVESDRDLLAGQARLDAAIPRALQSPDVARAIHAQIFDGGRPQDDVAVFAVTATPVIERLDLTTTSEPAHAAGIRIAVRRFLAGTSLDAERIDDIVTATGEALSNAMEHAYPGSIGELRVTGRTTRDLTTVEIRDFGAWRERTQEGRGLGMPLMHALSDDIELEQTALGTRVEITVRAPKLDPTEPTPISVG